MYLVDSEIRDLIEKNNLIENHSNDKISNICYDLRIENIIIPDKKENKEEYKNNTIYELNPGEVVFVSTIENLKMPNDLCGVIVEKNSLIRLGLSISSPVYQPGHHTKVFIRVQNISNSKIVLEKGKSIASIMFYKLSKSPDKPYEGYFSEEFEFTGVSNYSKELPKIKEINKKVETMENIEKNIYGNVMLLVTIFIGMFSLINLNLNFISSIKNNVLMVICFNLMSLGCIGGLVSFISLLLPNKKGTRIGLFIATGVLLIISIALYFISNYIQ